MAAKLSRGPKLEFLPKIREVITWRNQNAKGKPIWLTEFGWDSTTKPQQTEGDFKKWVGVTDLQQAQYLVRAFLVLATLDLDRAYIYWFNDEDVASVHASSGLTRKYHSEAVVSRGGASLCHAWRVSL